MPERSKKNLFIIAGLFVLVSFSLGWFFGIILEGEKPRIAIDPLPDFLSRNQKFKLNISDRKRGLKTLKVSLNQEGRETAILEKTFPFKGLFNRNGFHSYETEFSIDPQKLNLGQGEIALEVRVWDYSKRSWGDGNLSLVQHEMLVDTIPPAIQAISRMHHINLGGSGLVVYKTSSDAVESGVFVNDSFFPGFPVNEASKEWRHVCYFAVPHDAKVNSALYLWAKDGAGNTTKSAFQHLIRKKRFRTRKTDVSDRFLKRILPYFSSYPFDPETTDIERFVKINRDLRKENGLAFWRLRAKTSPEQLWRGPWLRLKNAATTARFADHRLYYYKGKKMDEQVHLGVDLASLAHSEIAAANHGRVIFSKPLGIYGRTVVVDHGQGLASVYCHLSESRVAPGQEIQKGDVVGLTGQTGLAGGDHLHFGLMVNGVFVNPVEWWDPHWMRDNVTRKLALLNK